MSLYNKIVNIFTKKNHEIEETKTGEKIPRTGEQSINAQAVDNVEVLFGSATKTRKEYNSNPDHLIQKKGIDIYEQMKLDDQVKANSTLKKVSRLSTENSVEDSGSSEQEKEIGNFVRYVLYDMMQTSPRNLLLSLMTGMDNGFALAEKNYKYIDDGKWQGFVGYKNINPKSPKTFHFDRNDDGSLKDRGIVQNVRETSYYLLTSDQKANLPRFRTDKFVVYSHMPEFGNPYGNSDLKSAFRPWLSKDVIMKYWLMYLERHAAPLPKGTIKEGATKKEAEAFITTMSNLSGKSAISLPDGFDIEYLESIRTAAPAFEEAIAIQNGGIDRSSIVPQLMGLSGGRGSGGSYGLGKTQYDVFIFYEEFIGLQLEDVFNKQVIKPLVDMNYLNVDKYPTWKFASIRRETRKDRAAILQMMVQTGIISKVDQWMFTFVDLPIPRSVMPEPGTPIMPNGVPPIDTDRLTRTKDPEERSAAEGTDPYADKIESEVT